MKRPTFYRGTALVLGTVLLAGCPANRRSPAKRSFQIMGTFATVSVASSLTKRADEAEATVREVFVDLDNRLSLFKPESEVCLLNRQAGTSDVPLSSHAARVLRLALHYSRISDGAFDPTVSPLLPLWGLQGSPLPDRLPDDDMLAAALDRVGYEHLSLSDITPQRPGSGKSVAMGRLGKPGMRLDLGGIAKGYAVDIAFERIHRLGIEDFMIDLGGNIRCAGSPRPGDAWTVGVRDPFDRERLLGTLELTGGMAVATSGNYERFVYIGGKKVAHILDPRTGRPVEGMAGVTVISPVAVETDAMSTALFVAGLQNSAELLRKTPNVEALIVPDRQPMEIWVTKGFLKHFRIAPGFANQVQVMDNAVP
ncbi:MAG: FAD:protein FMN transferase [Lentisphaerae bacterium]|nr:FAD:protein FMN transferase [Lentisphaerota bacterium]